MSEQTLNIPQLVAVILVGFLAIRWYFYTNSPTSNNRLRPQDSRNNPGARRADPHQVEQIAQMFPQADRRDIQWDLQRNGGSMAATTERLIAGRSLDIPPPSFQPQPPYPSPNPSIQNAAKPALPNLITRYNLSSKLNASESSALPSSSPSNTGTSTTTGKQQAWSTNKSERQQLLQRRREEMILAARRKLEEKDRARESGGVI
ncbi:MAG: hypothetical protein M1812_003020 [Candelaria pacifica]|nr:MAG: hypothetical protein M1812_003020 [Candelaria pacifica]